MSLLKIYIIEDDIKRTEKMKESFDGLKGKLKSGLSNNEAGEFLCKEGVDNIETIVVRTSKGKRDAKVVDYSFDDTQLENELNEILKNSDLESIVIQNTIIINKYN